LKGYDYRSGGAYFVTICTLNREPIFGEIHNSKMILNDWGKIITEKWIWLESHFEYVTHDEWILMPNHLHGIIVRGFFNDGGGNVNNVGRGDSRIAPTANKSNPRIIKPLGGIIGAFKTVSTKEINIRWGTPGVRIWHRNYYEHIIRNQKEWDSIRNYIRLNPMNWTRRGNSL